MGYEAIDPAIRAWAERHGLTLLTEFGGLPRRFCYVSGGDNECFQVSIEPPEHELISVNAWDVETEDGAVLHRHWQVASSDLLPALDAALEQIVQWSSRQRQSVR